MASANNTNAARARKLKHQELALELRRAGYSYDSIGRKIGLSKSRAHALVQMGLDEVRQQIAAAVDNLRAEEVSRLDGMLAKIYPKASRGDVAAIDRVLKIGERRAKLLGIEAPMRIETTGKDGAPIEVSSSLTIDPSKLSTRTLQELLDARAAPD